MPTVKQRGEVVAWAVPRGAAPTQQCIREAENSRWQVPLNSHRGLLRPSSGTADLPTSPPAEWPPARPKLSGK